MIEQVRLFAEFYGVRPDGAAIDGLLQRVGLTEKLSMLPDQLSGGQRQRLSLALALINQPEIVFLHEPTTGLDPQSRHTLWQIIRDLRQQGATVVLTTHYMDEAEALCDRVAIIDRGRLVALDTPGALVAGLAGSSWITLPAVLPVEAFADRPVLQSVRHDGTSLRIQTENVIEALQAVLSVVAAHDVRLGDIQIKQPSLEDMFLQLTGHEIRS